MNNKKEVLDTAVEVQHLSKTFVKGKIEIPVIHDISFALTRGSSTVITGESGSGKTTLLSLIAGIDTIDKGMVRIGTTTISDLNEKQRAQFRLKNIGFIFQHHYLLADLTALENIMVPLLMAGTKKKLAVNLAKEILYKIGMQQRMHHFPAQLSGGESQRVAIARALVHSPSLILADEPTGALDSKNSHILRDLLHELVEIYNCTLIVATHDKDFLSIATTHKTLLDGTLKTGSRTAHKR